MKPAYKHPPLVYLTWGLFAVISLALIACTPSRYELDNDRAPDQDLDISHIPEPTPRLLPKSARGNKSPYSVWGKSYQVMASSAGYRKEGIASWYGKKFHGYETSNGEIYDMYDFTAAHKHLPLPSYVRVTNLENGRRVIVRVNDRGPFHDDRIIDLSYAAAKKLGYLKQGTVRVLVEAFPFGDTPEAQRATLTDVAAATVTVRQSQYFLQVGAYADKRFALRTMSELNNLLNQSAQVNRSLAPNSLHRVRIGPFATEAEALEIRKLLQGTRFKNAMLLYVAP